MNIVMDWKNWRKNWSISYLISCTWLKLGSSAKKNIWKQIFQNIRCKWYMLTKVCLLLEHNWTILMKTWRLRNCVLKSVGKSLNLPICYLNEKYFLLSSSNSIWVSETDLLSSYPKPFSSVLRLHMLYLFDFMLYQAQSTIGLPLYQILNMSESINKIERKITGYKSRTFIYFICILSDMQI